jgi:uncharacterized membrane protein
MAERAEPAKKGLNPLTLALVIVIVVLAVIGGVFSPISNEFVPGIEGIVDTLLDIATYVIYLIGGGILTFGAVLVTVRFVRCKLKDPYQPSNVSRFLSGYLTLSLEFFIGAEIIRTVVTRTIGDLEVLFLIILSRGLFSFIIYLDRRWHGTAETE